jgi:acetyltransferase-like isoleucine patch superfamily enzyme
MKNLLIIGAGQYGMVAREIAESMKCFERIDFVDDVYPSAVGKICDIEKLIHEYDSAVVAIGNSKLRLNLIKRLCEIGYEVPSLIHEKAYVSPSAKIGIGWVCGQKVGHQNLMNPGSFARRNKDCIL